MPLTPIRFFTLPLDMLTQILSCASGEELYTRWRCVNREIKIQAELSLLSSQNTKSLPYQQRLLQHLAANPNFANQFSLYEKSYYLNKLMILLKLSTNLTLLDRVHGLLIIHVLNNQRYLVNDSLYEQALQRLSQRILGPDEMSILASQVSTDKKIS